MLFEEMNHASKNLSDNKISGRRELVLDLANLPTRILFDRSISNLQLFVPIPDELLTEVMQKFEKAQGNSLSNTATDANGKEDSRVMNAPVTNPYLPRAEPAQPNPFTRASGQYQSPKDRKRRNSAHLHTAKSTGAGRKRGTKNKPGHDAGGNRKNATYVTQIRCQSKLNFAEHLPDGGDVGGSDGGGSSGRDSDSDEDNDGDSDRSNERITRCKARDKLALKNAVKGLKLYAESIPNGTADFTVDHEVEEDDGNDYH